MADTKIETQNVPYQYVAEVAGLPLRKWSTPTVEYWHSIAVSPAFKEELTIELVRRKLMGDGGW